MGGRATVILIVDDDVQVRRLICQVLSRDGYRFIEAGDGREALDLCRTTPEVDLVVTDIRMPGMDGCDLGRHLWQLRPGLPVIFMSAHHDQQIDARSVLVRKPFRPDVLRQVVHRILELRAA